MRTEAEKLQQLLQHIGNNSASVQDLTDLVHVARSIAQAHFESHRYSITGVSNQHGRTLTDLAYDCVAELFAKAADGSYRHLTGFLNSLRGRLIDLPATDVFIAFRSFVARVADAQLAHRPSLHIGFGGIS